MSWLWIAGWGGLVAIDTTTVAQLMISRPLIAATISGAIFGHPVQGLVIGIILELAALPTLPIGAARYPDSGTAAAAASAGLAAALGQTTASTTGTLVGTVPAMILAAIAFALVWEEIAGRSVIAIRRLNERRVASEPLSARELTHRHHAAIGVDFVRGAILTLGGAWIALYVTRWTGELWALPAQIAPGVLVVASALLAGAALTLFAGVRRRALLFGAGVLGGCIILLIR